MSKITKKKIPGETHAIIPARSGSKGFKNKNIVKFLNKSLFEHSIIFAKKLNFVDKIIFSSDSSDYLKKAKKFQNVLLHKRSRKASSDKAMEEDILKDLLNYYKEKKIKLPKNILWLRPTNPLRCKATFEKAFRVYKKSESTVMIVHEVDSRLFFSKDSYLKPLIKEFNKKSMLRRQDVKPFYKIFSGEIFKLKKTIDKNFLSSKKRFVLAPSNTNFDIDKLEDIIFLNNLIKLKYRNFSKYIHNKI